MTAGPVTLPAAIAESGAAITPAGVRIEPLYDRTDLLRRSIGTVTRNLVEGGLLVIAVLLLALGSLRGGVIVSLAIPLSMRAAFAGIGLIVDCSVADG